MSLLIDILSGNNIQLYSGFGHWYEFWHDIFNYQYDDKKKKKLSVHLLLNFVVDGQ